MTVTTTTRTDPAARLTKGCMLIVFGLLVNVAPVAAADKDMSKEYSTCIDKSNGVTSEMLDCISAEHERQDARLNENYKRLISKLSPKRKEQLLEAQRAWVKFRDANCRFIMTRKAAPPRTWLAPIVCYKRQPIVQRN